MLLGKGICQNEDPKSAVFVGLLHNPLKIFPHLGSNEFLADGPDWYHSSKAVSGVSRSLCGDMCSITLGIQEWNPPG